MSFVLCKVGSHHLRVGANRRDDVCTELRASATTVLNLLVSSIVIYICRACHTVCFAGKNHSLICNCCGVCFYL